MCSHWIEENPCEQLGLQLFPREKRVKKQTWRAWPTEGKGHVDTFFIHHVFSSLVKQGRFWSGDNCWSRWLFKIILHKETRSNRMPGFKKQPTNHTSIIFRFLLALIEPNQFIIPPIISSDHGYIGSWQLHHHELHPPTQLCCTGTTVCSLTMNQRRELITVKNKPALCFVVFKDYFSSQVRFPIHCAAVQTVVSVQGPWIADGYPCA